MRTPLPTLLALCIICLPTLARAQDRERPPTPYDQGSIRGAITGGTSGSYVVLGGGIGYFVVDGLEVGVDMDVWFANDPTITKLSPSLRYFFWMVPVINPYITGFYRHWFVSDAPDLDSVGGSAGIAYVSGGRFFAGGGVVYERLLSCERDCDDIYPEFFVGASF